MITTLGILIILFGLTTLLLNPILKNKTFFQRFNTKRSIQILFVGIALSIVSGAVFYAEPGTAYAVQYPWGGQKAVFRQGVNNKMW